MSFFDPSTVEETSANSPLPDGSYRVIVDNVELKPTKAGTGEMIVVTYKVLAGQHKGRLVWSHFNYKNKSEKAQNIGRAQLKRFLASVGVTTALETEADFHRATKDKVLIIDVIIEGAFNKVQSWTADAPAARPQPSAAQGYSDPGF